MERGVKIGGSYQASGKAALHHSLLSVRKMNKWAVILCYEPEGYKTVVCCLPFDSIFGALNELICRTMCGRTLKTFAPKKDLMMVATSNKFAPKNVVSINLTPAGAVDFRY
jgi:hypothetical protein